MILHLSMRGVVFVASFFSVQSLLGEDCKIVLGEDCK